ncbi:MAG: hypothetical protein M3P91_10750 [Actinomycetota bacterium]|nr:hypothetical protein [Actinomycetota bacterium]
MNHKKVQRLWREDGLRVPQRRRRNRTGVSTTVTLPTAAAPNPVWAVDFQFDATMADPFRWSTNTPGSASAASSNATSPAGT